MLARFSTLAGEAGAADAERDVWGFGLKFYTKEGNWDLVGKHASLLCPRPLQVSGLHPYTEAASKTNMRSATAMWDFWSLSPNRFVR